MFENNHLMNSDTIASSTPTLEILSRATKNGAADAREAAIRSWNATALFSRRFIYTGCYSLSYGVVFPVMFVARAIPRDNMLVQGLVQGANDAISKVDEIVSKPVESHLILPASLTRDPS